MAEVKLMGRVAFSRINPNSGAQYHETIETSQALTTIYKLPTNEIYAIAASIEGDGTIEFSNDPPDVLDSGSPSWSAWDGVSIISLGVTAFRIVWGSGAVTAKVTVKTADQ